jgi:pimeloyl-ACP methyl ester carboxylesterase
MPLVPNARRSSASPREAGWLPCSQPPTRIGPPRSFFGAYARILRADDYPWGRTPEEYETLMRVADEGWGSGVFLPLVAPTVSDDESFKLWWARLERLSGSPGAILAFLRTHREADVRHVLPAIRVPTLVLQRRDDAYRHPDHGRYFAANIPGARYVELSGRDNTCPTSATRMPSLMRWRSS